MSRGYSCTPGNPKVAAVFSAQQLLSIKAQLAPRLFQKLQQYVIRRDNGLKGSSRRIVIAMPRKEARDRMPVLMKQLLRSEAEWQRANSDWFETNAPWLFVGDNRIPKAKLDAFFGGELADDDEPDKWDKEVQSDDLKTKRIALERDDPRGP